MQKIGGVILCVLAINGLAKADNSFSEIDLTSFHDIPSIIDACDVPIENISYSSKQNCRRFYITGLWGTSAATLTTSTQPGAPGPGIDEANTENIFNAGVAGGVSFERQRGRLRVEAEWLQRDFWAEPVNNGSPTRDVLTDNWSVMANVWRDFMFTNKFGCYGGGGIGGGGFAFTDNLDASGSGTAFAWQAGGGLIYQLTDQVTFDVGYRFYQLGDIPITDGLGLTLDHGFSASQVMFSMRMFEPLRSLLR